MVGEKGFEPSTPLVPKLSSSILQAPLFLTLFKCEKQSTLKVLR